MKKLRDLEKTQGFSKKLKDLAKKLKALQKNSMLRSQVTQSDSKKSPKKKPVIYSRFWQKIENLF